jgi:hypothetical protein
MDQSSKTSWWGRNWKWVVPVGCLAPLLVCGGSIALIFVFVFGVIRSSEPYTEALARAKENPEVKAALGEPIEVGYWVSGSIDVNGTSGTAKIAIPISGPKKSATIYVDGTKTAAKWEYLTFEVAPDGGGNRIDLRSQPSK